MADCPALGSAWQRRAGKEINQTDYPAHNCEGSWACSRLLLVASKNPVGSVVLCQALCVGVYMICVYLVSFVFLLAS